MTDKFPRGAPRPLAVSALLFLVLALQFASPPSASGARPPEGRTYYVALFGVEAPYEVRHECFDFTADAVCSLADDLCGTWQRTSRGARGSFSFQLSFLDDGAPVTLDGHGRVGATGRGSSIGGAGLQVEGNRRFNFAVLGRQATPDECRDLLAASSDDDGETVEGSGNPATESREVAGFDSVSLAGVGQLIIEHTGTESLTVTADDNILPLLTSEVEDGQLRLASEGQFSTRTRIVYRLTVARLDEILVSGAAAVESSDVDADELRVALAGASAAVLAGSVDRQIVDLSGACAYLAEDLDSRVATVDMVGASVAVVRVRELLEGSVAGASVLEYFGSPQVDVTVSGASTVRRAGD